MSISTNSLFNLGLTSSLCEYISTQNLDGFEIGRVIAEHKERYLVKTATAELDAEITGNMRFTAQNREDFPAVGDWVAAQVYDEHQAIIHKILPRFSIIKRKAVGHVGEVQLIATNVDVAFLVQAADRDFNLNRLERYLTICYSAKVDPVIVLTKTDLTDEASLSHLMAQLNARISDVQVIALSNETKKGVNALKSLLKPGKTYCLLGSSGVGKSSLVNNLTPESPMKTDAISDSNHKGRHVTTHRELVLLPGGGVLIDNPGMREVGIADTEGGLEATFDAIMEHATECKYQDCSHTVEKGCAVLGAVESGDIDEHTYQNYVKMEKERAYFESTSSERKKRGKELGKLIKKYYQQDVKGRK